MSNLPTYDDVALERHGLVAVLEIRRPPLNFFDEVLIGHLTAMLQALDNDAGCRAVVLGAAGSTFCAGADFGSSGGTMDMEKIRSLYQQAAVLFETRKPIVAAIQGAAVGGGLGVALVADFRVTCDKARFSANFAKLGLHCGFGISVTLPRLVGANAAAMMLYTGRRLSGSEALAIGLADQLVEADQVRAAAIALATELAASSPLALQDMRATLRTGLGAQVRSALEREHACQSVHSQTADFREGVLAMSERRSPVFTGS